MNRLHGDFFLTVRGFIIGVCPEDRAQVGYSPACARFAGLSDFQDRRIQPLCHLSKCPLTSIVIAVSANGLANGDRSAEPFANIC